MSVQRRRWWPLLGVAPLAASVLGLGATAPARAAVPVSKVGWWTRSPSPAGPPQGGIEVGAAPDGNLSVAAFELDTGGGASGAKLTLTESGGQGQQAAALQACPTADQWAAASGGDISLAPRAQCPSQPYALTRDSSGNWTVDLTALLAGKTGPVSVMIVPGPAAAALPVGAQPAAFQVAFNPPAVDGTTLPATDSSTSASSSSGLSSGADTSGASATSTASTPSYSVASSPAYGGSGTGASAILPTSSPDTTPAAPAPAAPAPAPASVAPSTAGGAQLTFPIRPSSTHTKAKSPLVIVGWFFLSCVVGAGAAGWRWARQSGVLDRLLPSGRGANLLPPAG